MARKYVKSRPGLFGMVYYYDENGKPIGKSRPGLIEGTRVYTDQNGRYAGRSRPGFLSKEVYKDTDHNYIISYGAPLGDIHFKNGTPIGRSRPGLFGSSYTSLETEDEIYEDEFYEDETDFIEEDFAEEPYEEYEDEADEECPHQTTLSTVGGKLKSLVLFLVVCAVIVCMCAITKR